MNRPLDPAVVDFVKALARANAARDSARVQKGDLYERSHRNNTDVLAGRRRRR